MYNIYHKVSKYKSFSRDSKKTDKKFCRNKEPNSKVILYTGYDNLKNSSALFIEFIKKKCKIKTSLNYYISKYIHKLLKNLLRQLTLFIGYVIWNVSKNSWRIFMIDDRKFGLFVQNIRFIPFDCSGQKYGFFIND